MNDAISIYSSILSQSIKSKKVTVFVPKNRINLMLSSLFYKHNFIYSYTINLISNKIKLTLNQLDNKFVFNKITRVSKPSRRVYWNVSDLKRKTLKEGRFFIISTNIGLITSNEAIAKNISGEILMEISF